MEGVYAVILPGMPRPINGGLKPPIAFRSHVNGSAASNGRSYTIAKPAGTAAGDLLVLGYVHNNLYPYTLPEGFELQLDHTMTTNGMVVIATRKATDSEPASYTTTTNDNGWRNQFLTAYENGSGIDVIGSIAQGNLQSHTAPSITPTKKGILLAVFARQARNLVSSPAGMIPRASLTTAAILQTYELDPSPAGVATGAKTITIADAASAYSAFQMQLY